MGDFDLREGSRFVIRGYAGRRPFASFLPGIAGPLGIPMWVFYVNRGQAIASFGIENKDNPIMEFEPANKAYQTTPYTGFRTFLKLKRGSQSAFYEPFSPWDVGDQTQMSIGMNDLELEATSAAHAVRTNVLYFILPGEPFAGLVRQVTVTNTGAEPLAVEILDGMARVMPFGVDNWGLKEMGRTSEAYMAVFNLEAGLPFYRYQSGAGDSAEVSEIQAGHFYLSFDSLGRTLLPFVDPVLVFGQNTALSTPDGFVAHSLHDLSQIRQITTGRTPCGFFGVTATVAPGETTSLYAVIGHTGNIERARSAQQRLAQPEYVRQKRQESRQLVDRLTDAVATHTSSARLDAYTRQTFLDNLLRGGWPFLLGDESEPTVYHVYSRKHGDLERDYNYFVVAAEPYSQGEGNYRDVNQNRRCDVLLNPRVEDYNLLALLGLIQADGYNPLVVEGARFTVPAEHRASILALVDQPEKLEPALARPFTPGRLLRTIADQQMGLNVSPEAFIAACLAHAEQHFEATFHVGYWIDHWFYNLDLIDTYLAAYPDKKEELLFGRWVPFFDSSAVVQPRALKYVLASEGKVRQYGAVVEDEEKAALIAARGESPNLLRTAHGGGEVFYSTIFAKLVGMALLKFATLDPMGMGIEMEAGKPGWYDALNGLPGLLGSSLCETYELERLLTFLLESMAEKGEGAVQLPIEQDDLLEQTVGALQWWCESDDPARDWLHWDRVSTARETYRAHVRLGFDGETEALSFEELEPVLTAFRAKARDGIRRAVEMNGGIPPTYFTFTVTDYERIVNASGMEQCDAQGRPYVVARQFKPHVLPLFLEGPVHALKVPPDLIAARSLYARIKDSDLYDRKLGMYKVNASLADQSHEIGRARAFTPGWLENESVFLHMEYKYLLEVLRAGLYEEFYDDFRRALICFQDAETYGRSPLENSSFLVSSAHPDESLHGAGFVARLTGATAEFLSIWTTMMAGRQPFFMRGDELCLTLRPILPGWLFSEDGTLSFTFLGHIKVTYHNPERVDTWNKDCVDGARVVLRVPGEQEIAFPQGVVGMPHAEWVRTGRVESIDVFL